MRNANKPSPLPLHLSRLTHSSTCIYAYTSKVHLHFLLVTEAGWRSTYPFPYLHCHSPPLSPSHSPMYLPSPPSTAPPLLSPPPTHLCTSLLLPPLPLPSSLPLPLTYVPPFPSLHCHSPPLSPSHSPNSPTIPSLPLPSLSPHPTTSLPPT